MLITRGHLILHTALFHSSGYLSCIINRKVSWNHCYNHNNVFMAWVKPGNTQYVSRWLITDSRVGHSTRWIFHHKTKLHAITIWCQAVMGLPVFCAPLHCILNNMIFLGANPLLIYGTMFSPYFLHIFIFTGLPKHYLVLHNNMNWAQNIYNKYAREYFYIIKKRSLTASQANLVHTYLYFKTSCATFVWIKQRFV